MQDASADIHVSIHNTPPAIFDAFARVWPVTTSQGTTWCAFRAENGVRVTLFQGSDDSPEQAS